MWANVWRMPCITLYQFNLMQHIHADSIYCFGSILFISPNFVHCLRCQRRRSGSDDGDDDDEMTKAKNAFQFRFPNCVCVCVCMDKCLLLLLLLLPLAVSLCDCLSNADVERGTRRIVCHIRNHNIVCVRTTYVSTFVIKMILGCPRYYWFDCIWRRQTTTHFPIVSTLFASASITTLSLNEIRIKRWDDEDQTNLFFLGPF